jgi:hypothetical protein
VRLAGTLYGLSNKGTPIEPHHRAIRRSRSAAPYRRAGAYLSSASVSENPGHRRGLASQRDPDGAALRYSLRSLRQRHPDRPDHRNTRRCQGMRALMPRTGGAAEHAKLGAMRVVELDAIAGRRECSSKLELRVVGQQRARDDGRLGCTLVLDHHSCGCAHDVHRRLAENSARSRSLRAI